MKNITVKEYTELQDASLYDATLHFMMPFNSCCNKKMNINSMPYVNVKHCMRILPKIEGWNTVQELFEICFDVDADSFWSMPVTEFFQSKNYMIEEFDRAIKTEVKLLTGHSTNEHLWKMAGADKLQPYNDTLPLVQLGKMFGQYPFDLGRKPYGEIFSLLVQTKTQNEVEIEYQKLSK